MSLVIHDLPAFALVLATLVLVPLGVDLILAQRESAALERALRRLKWAGFPAAAALAASFWIPQSPLAAGLAAPWMLVTWGYAGIGLLRWSRRRLVVDAPLGADLALMLISIGGTWAFLHRLGRWPGGFEPIIALLTAVHFHYAGFVLPLVASLIAVELKGWLARWLAPTIAFSALLLAVGITMSPAIELLAAGLVVGAALLAASLLWRVAGRMLRRASRWLLRIAGVSLAVGSGLAMLYAAGEYTDEKWIDIPRMIPLHGLTMAVGFALPALLGLWIGRMGQDRTRWDG